MSRTHRLITIAGTVLATVAIAAGSANAYPAQDLRSPDSRDAASTSIPAGTTSATAQDLRSPDARDSAERPAAPVVVRVERTADSSLSWDMIGLGALISTGLLITIAGAYVLIGRRRTHGPHVA